MRKASLQRRILFVAALALLLPVVATANTVDTVPPIEQGNTAVSSLPLPSAFPVEFRPVIPWMNRFTDTYIYTPQITQDDFALSEDLLPDATPSLAGPPVVARQTVNTAAEHEPINLLLLMTGLFGLLGLVSKPA